MIYTKDEEIKVVKENLQVFENKVPQKYLDLLLQKQIRYSQHGLFFSLCNPAIYPCLLEAIEVIKRYDKPRYFPKAINKLVKGSGWIDQQGAVAEVIIVGYYVKKFAKDKKIKVEWERKISNSSKVMDISLLGLSKPVNIEVTAKDRDERFRKHFELRDKVKVAIEQTAENFPDQHYSYIFSLVTEEKDGKAITDFSEKHIQSFIDFIFEMRNKGEGEYDFIIGGEKLASIKITKLNKLDREYATHLDMWSGFMKDEKRLRNRIVDKAKDQLPQDEVNFVFIPNLGNFDDISFQEAFLGKEQWHIGREGIRGVSRKPDGAIQVTAGEGYSPVHGLMWSGWDYLKKKTILNPLLEIEDELVDLVK